MKSAIPTAVTAGVTAAATALTLAGAAPARAANPAAADIETCRAVGVAVNGPKSRVADAPFASELEAEEALSKAAVDLVVAVTPDATAMGLSVNVFGPPVCYDGQGQLVRGDAAVASVAGLAGRKAGVVEGTDNKAVLLARIVARGIAIVVPPFQEAGEMKTASRYGTATPSAAASRGGSRCAPPTRSSWLGTASCGGSRRGRRSHPRTAATTRSGR